LDNVVLHNDTTQRQAFMEIVKTVLQQMSNITKPQRKFIMVLLPLLELTSTGEFPQCFDKLSTPSQSIQRLPRENILAWVSVCVQFR